MKAGEVPLGVSAYHKHLHILLIQATPKTLYVTHHCFHFITKET